MRTINATLQAALDAGGFNAYIKARVRRLAFDQTYDVLSYRLTGLTLQIEVEGQIPSGDPGAPATIELIRGATISGVDYTVSTSKFIVTNGTNQKVSGVYHTGDVQCHLINPIYMSFLADGSYQAAISSFCTALGKTYTLKAPSATFWTNQFLPTGKSFTTSNAQTFLNLLRQKFFIYACDNGAENILFYSAMNVPVTEDYIITPKSIYYVEAGYKPKRRFFAKDESDVIRYSGTAGDSLHNLGFILSSNSLPTRYEQEQHIAPYPIAPQLYPQDGDDIVFDEILLYPAKITERFDPSMKSIPWRVEIQQERIFGSYEGESAPDLTTPADPFAKQQHYHSPWEKHRASTTNYNPLNAGVFTGRLSPTDNNIQAAMETLDQHNHGVLAPVQAPTATNDFLIGAQVSTVWTWVKNTLAQTITVLRTSLDAVYAPIAKGVTNGDSHDHNGGDGAQISFLNLSNLPVGETNTNDIFRCDSPGGVSAFVGTINGAPSGTTVNYNVTSGQEGAMVPTSTSQLGKMRLYNTTRGTNALISNCNTATNAITLTANAPAGWANGDTITIASQTVSGGGFSWVDIEITSGPTSKTYMFLELFELSATAGNKMQVHALETYADSKLKACVAQAVSVINESHGILLKITSNVFSVSWTGTPTAVGVREQGYLY